jgi:hypothetical protein
MSTFTTTTKATKTTPQVSKARSITGKRDSRIYVQRSFVVTALEGEEVEGTGERKASERPTMAWEASRGSSQEVLVREGGPETVK